MSVFLERLRTALGADYEVLDELASGGMGVVYRARDRSLDRLVAIKVIHPDLATAQAAERFLREARILASFRHPNIVPVHRAGEADGLAYYVMDYLEGETLAERLRRGPLTPAEFATVAADLLAALAVVHAHGVVHRDVKPANIFLAGGRAVLSDFGVSKTTSQEVAGLTAPGKLVGTPGYMPPEQLAGSDVNERTDVCAAGMVLFEACTGRPWTFDSHTEQADWASVPASAAPAIRRALNWAPAQRWANAGEFHAAITGRAPPRRRVAAAFGTVLVLVAIVTWGLLFHRPPGAPLRVNIHRLASDAGGDAALGDSLADQLVLALRASADIEFRRGASNWISRTDFDVAVGAARLGDSLRVRLTTTGRGARTPFEVTTNGTRSTVVESLADSLLLGIWSRRDTSFADLPVGALPKSVPGMAAWAHAEALYASARWFEAGLAYHRAVVIDPTCALCELRLMIVSRWLRLPPDSELTRRVRAALGRFTPHYQQLVRAGVDTPNRWAALDAMVAASPKFDLAQFVYGDELFHRGALAGRDRRDALNHFQQAIALRPRFAPTWGHLAWVAIAEDEQATAFRALATYDSLVARDDQESMVVLFLLQLGFAWRFLPNNVAAAATQKALDNPMIADFDDLYLGARYLEVFDAPTGVVWLGREFVRSGKPELQTPGFVAQVVGLLAQGKVDSARTAIGLLRGERQDPEYQLCAAEFETALVLFDSLDARALRPRLDALLASLTEGSTGTSAVRRRAAWMRVLLARRAGAPEENAWHALVAGEAGLRPFAALLSADSVARLNPRRAILMTDTLLSLDSARATSDPFFRSALHLMRAQWQASAGDSTAAIHSLLWHENYDLVGHFEGVMEPADADAAFGTVGRWYRARLERFDASGHEVCEAWAGVARLWAQGDPPYRRRAAEASREFARLGCTAR